MISTMFTKDILLSHFRELAQNTYDKNKTKKNLTTVMNTIIKRESQIIVNPIKDDESLSNNERLDKILLVYYCSYVVMIEFRNKIRPYEYMDFTRRIGELWEPFCKLCWEYTSLDDIAPFTPPKFDEAKRKLLVDLTTFMDTTSLTTDQKAELNKYLELMWELIASGEIKLESDLHFKKGEVKHNIDFKSGFNSNEKGNTNRLLMVGSIYKKLNPNYVNIILVRAEENENNHYLQTLKNSNIWSVYCGKETYIKIQELTGFPLKTWIEQNIDWENDLNKETIDYLKQNNLSQYLRW
ncbi:hypothetical protein ACLM5H_24570 [Fredinandcohnia humi]